MMNVPMILQITTALVGCLGFAIVFKMKGRQIILAGLGGAITWSVYLIGQQFIPGFFLPYFVAALFVAVYAEIMARVNRAPATLFLTATAIPLIPGGSLYYAMAGLVNMDKEAFSVNAESALTIALAISLGFVTVAILTRYLRIFLQR
jgi:uncharacterized membrane protein YjjB (DUF3815 family)